MEQCYVRKLDTFVSVFAIIIAEGNLEVKLPMLWTDEAEEVGRVREEKRRKKIKIRENVEKSRNTFFSPCFVFSDVLPFAVGRGRRTMTDRQRKR